MKSDLDWTTCYEIGLNHLGKKDILNKIVDKVSKYENISLSLQIREEEFYKNHNNLSLERDVYDGFSEKCQSLGIPFGFALGPIDRVEDLIPLLNTGSFVKAISISTANESFVQKLSNLSCPIFFSIGLSDDGYIKERLLPLMKESDFLVHTSLSHSDETQSLMSIKILKDLHENVAFSLHAKNHEIVFTALGCGYPKVFIYVGDKRLDLPDYDHAIDLKDSDSFTRKINSCVIALKSENRNIKKEINFIG